MARLPRLFVEGVPLHVIVRGNNRQDVFRGEGDRIFFHRCLCELSSRASVKIHAYVMMSNHVHLLATGKQRESISWLMQQLGRRYVTYFNYLHRRTGGLWEGRFRSTLVQAERYFLTCQRYIELNPVRAGIVSHPEAFAWSSYRRCANGVPDDAVTPHPLYDNLALDVISRRAAYRELFLVDIDAETLRKIRSCTQHGWALGTDEFCELLRAKSGRRPAPLPLGRPRKREFALVESDPANFLELA